VHALFELAIWLQAGEDCAIAAGSQADKKTGFPRLFAAYRFLSRAPRPTPHAHTPTPPTTHHTHHQNQNHHHHHTHTHATVTHTCVSLRVWRVAQGTRNKNNQNHA
jgi:hypothetical protein